MRTRDMVAFHYVLFHCCGPTEEDGRFGFNTASDSSIDPRKMYWPAFGNIRGTTDMDFPRWH